MSTINIIIKISINDDDGALLLAMALIICVKEMSSNSACSP